jgi:uncharacterized protein YecT (DUF1311 family)
MPTNNHRVRVAGLIGAITLVAVPLRSDEPRHDCRDGGRSQLEMNACAFQRADAAKKRLAALVVELDGVLQPAVRQSLASVQAHWVALRELDCKWERSLFEGGSVAALVYATCIADQTEQRIDRLKPFLCEGAGMTGPCDASGKY